MHLYVVDQELDLESTAHPLVKKYYACMKYITKWGAHSPRWLPTRTWKSKLMSMYPKQFKGLTSRGLESKPCSRCPTVEKQLEKANVSPVEQIIFHIAF
jgi:hypothetical protein